MVNDRIAALDSDTHNNNVLNLSANFSLQLMASCNMLNVVKAPYKSVD